MEGLWTVSDLMAFWLSLSILEATKKCWAIACRCGCPQRCLRGDPKPKKGGRRLSLSRHKMCGSWEWPRLDFPKQKPVKPEWRSLKIHHMRGCSVKAAVRISQFSSIFDAWKHVAMGLKHPHALVFTSKDLVVDAHFPLQMGTLACWKYDVPINLWLAG